MANLEREILSIIEPKINLDTISWIDTESDSRDPKMSKTIGGVMPLVSINGYTFKPYEIQAFRLSEEGFLPTLSLTIGIADGMFISRFYPKDGDVVSIFIRSQDKLFKPIRCDFDILNISSNPIASDNHNLFQFNISGILRIPLLFGETCKSWKDTTAFDVLGKVASELNVGYASNETNTTDAMTWICPFDTRNKFLRDVTHASYLSDDAFFISYFDKHYYLNFVNLNKQFTHETLEIESILSAARAKDSLEGQPGNEDEKKKSKLLLSNISLLANTNMYINSFSLVNNSGEIVYKNGYRRFLQYYDRETSEYKSYFIEPLNTSGSEEKIILRGRVGEDFQKDQSKYKWVGDTSDNHHSEFLHAQLQNHINENEIQKMGLKIRLETPNFSIYRSQAVPVYIVYEDNSKRTHANKTASGNFESRDPSLDPFISGNYVIASIELLWDSTTGKWNQEILLYRREWTPRAEVAKK